MVLDVIISILTDLAVDPIRYYVVAPIKRHVSYAFTYNSNLEKLKNQVQMLSQERDDLRSSANDATRRGDELRPRVQEWLNNANGAIQRANHVIRNEDEATRSCFNLKKRYQVSKNAEKEALAITKLQGGSGFDRICRRPTLKQRGASSVDEQEALDSRSSIFMQVMDALADPEVNMVGVYGMSGIGKTTLAHKVRRKAIEDKSFDLVFLATVSSTPDLDSIRQQIAELLGLTFKEETADGKADRLHQILIKKQILVILDDIWKQISLQTVGIPHGKEHQGCKILFTSRSKKTLLSMNSGTNFYLETLSDREAWCLFKKMVGEIKNEVEDIATQVARKCRGVPLLISTVARALKNRELNDWKYALQQLPSDDNEDVQTVLQSALEMSYNHLITKEVKTFFLLCGQLGEPEILIDNLFMYSVGLDLLKRVDTMEKGRITVLKWISDLKASCFLLDSHRHGFVRIHDLARDAALNIARRDQNVIAVKSEAAAPEKWPEEHEFDNCSRISLPNCKFDELPSRLECQNASLLILGCEDDSRLEIPDSFFQETKSLKVLHLSNFYFSSLPTSLGSLTNLRTLCLRGCGLFNAATIGELSNLEMLSLFPIEKLPGEIGQLTRLKLLDLRDCYLLDFIPSGVLSRLSLLEELYISKTFNRWGMETSNNQRNACLDELEGLSRLTTLDICIPDAKIIPRDLFSNKLERCNIHIGEIWQSLWWSRNGNFSKILKLELSESILWESWVKMLLKKAEDLCLDFNAEKGTIKNVVYDLDTEGFPLLKYLHLQNGPKIQYVVNSSMGAYVFPILQCLSLDNLTSLEKICHGPLATGSFSNLTILRVKKCHNLKDLFSLPTVCAFSKLEVLGVSNCHSMEEIVAKESENDGKEAIVFTRLRALELEDLPQLQSFCSGVSQKKQEQLTKDNGRFNEIVSEFELDTSPSLFNEMVAFPVLEEIRIQNINMKKIWQSPLPTSSFSKLKSMVVEGCEKLETIFPCNVMGTFQRLEKLRITNCGSVQEIYQLREENHEDAAAFDLKELYIENLPKLKHLWSKDPQGTITFQNLQSVRIQRCEVLEDIFPSSEARSAFQEIVVAKVRGGSPKPFSLELVSLPRLRYVFTESTALKLQELSIRNCEMLEEIMRSELAEGTTVQQITFPSLNSIQLSYLPKLSCFYSGSGNLYFPSLKRIEISVLSLDSPRPGIDDQGSVHGIGDQQLHMHIAPFFSHKVAPNVEELVLNDKAMEMILQSHLISEEFLSKIKIVHVRNPKIRQKSAVVSHFIKRLKNLEELYLAHSLMKELFGEEEASALPPIRKLELKDVKYLKHMWKQHSEQHQQQLFLHVTSLEVSECRDLINLAPSSARFVNLTALDVYFCNRFANYLVTASVAQSMARLVRMTVGFCENLKEIVAANEEAGNSHREEIITFGKLETLNLRILDNLECFSSSSYTFAFPSLKKVIVDRCPKMKSFCPKESSTPKLKRVVSGPHFDEKCYWKGNLNATVQHMLSEMVGFGSYVHGIKLSDYTWLKDGWNSQLPSNVLGNLRGLTVDNCPSFSIALPSNVLHSLNGLENLTVEKCDSVEQIFDSKGLINADHEVMRLNPIANLTSLHLIDLPKLKHVFTVSMALGLASLRSMEVKRCSSLEQIIKTEDDEEDETNKKLSTVFPQFHTVELEHLPALTSFYSGSGVIECPVLRKIDVVDCPKLKILQFLEESQDKVVVRSDSHVEVPRFFNARVGVPSIEEVGAEWVEMMEILHGNYEAEWFRRLKVIKLRRYPGERELLPPNFFEKLPNLEEISLELSNLPNMKKFERSTCFQNVTKLEISECDGLVFLFPSSAPKTLAQLKFLWIDKCKMLQKIVAGDDEGDGAEDGEICFSQLEDLRLESLSCLTSFCSHNYAFSFPSLACLLIDECPNIKYFAPGVLSTPKLGEVRLDGNYYWDDSLDNTIRGFAEMRDED